jgi:hypothetical protein
MAYQLKPSDYLHSMAQAEQVPSGRVLVHNNVRPRKTFRWEGFRAWTQPLDETLEQCPCKWARQNADGHLKHYRKKRPVSRAWAGAAR